MAKNMEAIEIITQSMIVGPQEVAINLCLSLDNAEIIGSIKRVNMVKIETAVTSNNPRKDSTISIRTIINIEEDKDIISNLNQSISTYAEAEEEQMVGPAFVRTTNDKLITKSSQIKSKAQEISYPPYSTSSTILNTETNPMCCNMPIFNLKISLRNYNLMFTSNTSAIKNKGLTIMQIADAILIKEDIVVGETITTMMAVIAAGTEEATIITTEVLTIDLETAEIEKIMMKFL